jgi:hypothetical protein
VLDTPLLEETGAAIPLRARGRLTGAVPRRDSFFTRAIRGFVRLWSR